MGGHRSGTGSIGTACSVAGWRHRDLQRRARHCPGCNPGRPWPRVCSTPWQACQASPPCGRGGLAAGPSAPLHARPGRRGPRRARPAPRRGAPCALGAPDVPGARCHGRARPRRGRLRRARQLARHARLRSERARSPPGGQHASLAPGPPLRLAQRVRLPWAAPALARAAPWLLLAGAEAARAWLRPPAPPLPPPFQLPPAPQSPSLASLPLLPPSSAASAVPQTVPASTAVRQGKEANVRSTRPHPWPPQPMRELPRRSLQPRGSEHSRAACGRHSLRTLPRPVSFSAWGSWRSTAPLPKPCLRVDGLGIAKGVGLGLGGPSRRRPRRGAARRGGSSGLALGRCAAARLQDQLWSLARAGGQVA